MEIYLGSAKVAEFFNSTPEFILEVMLQFLYCGEGKLVFRLAQGLSIQSIVVTPVFKLFTDPSTDLDLQTARLDGQVTQVEKFMKITPE
jgi:hypothetical protein